MRYKRALCAGLALSVAGFASFAGCGAASNRDPGTFDDGGSAADGSTDPTLDGSSLEAGPGFKDVSVSDCKTTISGTIYDPAGQTPLYNVVVYAPSTKIDPLPQGASCDKCGATASGNPTTSTVTDAHGNFTLDKAPDGKDVPLVIQVGKWRRQIKVPTVTRCKDNKITDHDLTRLPKSQREGDLPQIGLVTGSLDAIECLLTKIGIDGGEFTNQAGNGRIHVFKQSGGASTKDGSTPANALWHSDAEIKKYDIVMFACDGSPVYGDQVTGSGSTEAAESARVVYNYLNNGGRVFGTHYHYFWFKFAPAPMNGTADYGDGIGDPNTPSVYSIDTSFPKGQAFADWLDTVGASAGKAKIQLNSGDVRNSIANIKPTQVQRWIYSGNFPKYITFNAPVGQQADSQCGRAVFSDLHVSPGDLGGSGGAPIPDSCSSGPLTPQEQALEFLFFDLSACVQDQSQPPVLPH